MTLLDRHSPLLDRLAVELGCEARALRALLRVEAAGEGLVDGRPIVRLEVHRLWSACSPAARLAVDGRFRVGGPRPWEGHLWRPAPGSAWARLHTPGEAGQRAEWLAVTLARSIDERAAIESTSWGCGQILGSWWMELGAATPTAWAAAQADEGEQLRSMVGVLRAMGLAGPLASRAWPVVARTYNGPGQVDWYARQLAEAYAAG